MEAYVTPSGDGRVEVALLWDQSKTPPELQSEAPFQALIQRFPGLARRLKDQVADSRFAGAGPLAWQALGDWPDRTLLVGDSLGYGDGITGEGLSVGFHQALKLAEQLPACLAERGVNQTALLPIRATLTQTFLETLPTLRAALTLARYPFLRRLAIRGLSRSPDLFSHFLAANMGLRPLWRFPIRGLLWGLWGLIYPGRKRAEP